jgi:glycosyltransferase involved in cell wall biosynthesis
MTAPTRPVIVFATRRVPVRAQSGGTIRAHRLLMGLAERFDVVLVAFDREPGDGREPPPEPAEIARELPGVETVAVRASSARKRLQQLVSVPTRRSWSFGRYATPALGAAIHRVAREGNARLVHFDGPGVFLVGAVPGAINAVAPYDVEHEIQRAAAERTTGLRRVFAQLEARKVLGEERAQWSAADICVAVSDLDEQAMRRGGARNVLVVPNGTDAVPRQPIPRRSGRDPLRILFVGAPYLPNRLGVEWLIAEVLPDVRERMPVVLDVVGLLPDQVPRAAGVTVHGRVPSVDPFYKRAHVAVIPIFEGSGSRLKVVESMARGVPTLSTTLGAAGLGLTAGIHYRVADDPASFATALVDLGEELARRPDQLEPMLASARAAAERLFWPRIAARLATEYEAALEERRVAEPV